MQAWESQKDELTELADKSRRAEEARQLLEFDDEEADQEKVALSSRRGPQAALTFSYRSDSVTRL